MRIVQFWEQLFEFLEKAPKREQIKLFFIALTIGEIYLLIGILLLKLGGL